MVNELNDNSLIWKTESRKLLDIWHSTYGITTNDSTRRSRQPHLRGRRTNKVFPLTLRSAIWHPPTTKTTPTKRSSSTRKCIGTFRQRRRRRRGGGSVQSQLEVQQIDTFGNGDMFGNSGGGHGQGHRLRNDTFSRESLSMPLHLPPMTTNYIAQWQVSLC